MKTLHIILLCVSTTCLFSLHAMEEQLPVNYMERPLFVHYPKDNLTVIQTPNKDYGLPRLDREFMPHKPLTRVGNFIKVQGRLRIYDGKVEYDNTCQDEDDAFDAGELCVAHIIAQLHQELGDSLDAITHCTSIKIYVDDELESSVATAAEDGVKEALNNIFDKKIDEQTKLKQTLSSTWPGQEALVWVNVEFEIKADEEKTT